MITNVTAYKCLHADISTALQVDRGASPLAIARRIGASAEDIKAWRTDKTKPQFLPKHRGCVHSLMIYVCGMPYVCTKYSIQQPGNLTPNRQAVQGRGPTIDEILVALKAG
ncbi:MAG: hypothetical protein WAO98_08630 [Alphaproteobacteria bacterium]